MTYNSSGEIVLKRDDAAEKAAGVVKLVANSFHPMVADAEKACRPIFFCLPVGKVPDHGEAIMPSVI